MPYDFATLRSGGLDGFIGQAVADAGLSDDQLAAARKPTTAFTRAAGYLDNFLGGAVVPVGETSAGLRAMAAVFSALATATDEAADLVDLNPGTLAHRVANGIRIDYRTWP